MKSQLLCKDCKHGFRQIKDLPIWNSEYAWKCRKSWIDPKKEENPVIGPRNFKGYYESCSIVRLHRASYNNNCGKEGLWWEPKNKKGLFLLIKNSERSPNKG